MLSHHPVTSAGVHVGRTAPTGRRRYSADADGACCGPGGLSAQFCHRDDLGRRLRATGPRIDVAEPHHLTAMWSIDDMKRATPRGGKVDEFDHMRGGEVFRWTIVNVQ